MTHDPMTSMTLELLKVTVNMIVLVVIVMVKRSEAVTEMGKKSVAVTVRVGRIGAETVKTKSLLEVVVEAVWRATVFGVWKEAMAVKI